MSEKELRRKSILDEIVKGRLKIKDAAKKLSVSSKTISRGLKRYKKLGVEGLIHRSRNRSSNRATDPKLKDQALKLYVEKYEGFGPTLASEKLEEDDGIKVHPETLRLWLKQAGLWSRHRKRKGYRSRRARRSRFGELLQLDGSIHPWFDGIEEKQCLMNMVDDATSKTLSLMDYGETTRAAFSLLKWWIKDAGIPAAIYVDLKSLYVSPKSLKEKVEEREELIEPEWLSHFSSACKKLGIEVIKAYSAQAKGRVERNHAVYQDRFVKELKLKGIKTIEEANGLLSGGFVNKLNEKFAKPAASDEDAHVPLSVNDDLDQILCWEYKRQVKNDWSIQFENKFYQIKNIGKKVQPKQKITVRRHLDESISLWSNHQPLEFMEIDKLIKKEEKTKSINSSQRSKISKENKHKSPWSQFNPQWLKSKGTTVGMQPAAA
ncbi:MAG: ISNCY family transposase [Bacteroidota bacterium]|nr:ISNCY family transposase [Bacteroidota bacterium]